MCRGLSQIFIRKPCGSATVPLLLKTELLQAKSLFFRPHNILISLNRQQLLLFLLLLSLILVL